MYKKSFNNISTLALSTLKCYYFVVVIIYIATKSANTESACQYTVKKMECNAERWMDTLEVQGNALNSFLQLKKLYINQYTPLDNKNIAQDKLCKL